MLRFSNISLCKPYQDLQADKIMQTDSDIEELEEVELEVEGEEEGVGEDFTWEEGGMEVVEDLDDFSEEDFWESAGDDEKKALKWLRWKHRHGITDKALKEALALAGFRKSLVAQVRSKIRRSDLAPRSSDCCSNGCVAFLGRRAEKEHCPACLEPRFEGQTRKPRKTFLRLPLLPRIKRMLGDEKCWQAMQNRGQEMRRMRSEVIAGVRKERAVSDCVHGKNYMQTDLIDPLNSEDICLSLTLDGKSMQRGSDFHIWPIVISNLNLSPARRSKLDLMMPVVIAPGPLEPHDVDSFIAPLLTELRNLGEGVLATRWDGARVRVRVHLLFATADPPAMAKLMQLTGSKGKSLCRFCSAKGAHSKRSRGHCFPSQIETGQGTLRLFDARRIELLERTPLAMRANWSGVSSATSVSSKAQIAKEAGVKGKPTLFDSSSRLAPFTSAPPDIFHLFCYISKFQVEIWKGNAISDAADGICIQDFEEIGRELERSGQCAPLAHGSRPRNIALKGGRFKTEEWKSFTLRYSIPLIEDRLNLELVLGWKRFAEVCRLCYLPSIDRSELETLNREAVLFFEHYEQEHCRNDEKRLKFMRSAHHYLLHLWKSVLQCGPLAALDQSKVERCIGSLQKSHHTNFRMAESVMKNIAEAEAAKHLELQMQGPSAFNPVDEELSHRFELMESGCFLTDEEKTALQQVLADSSVQVSRSAVRSCKRYKRIRVIRGQESVSFRTKGSRAGRLRERRNCCIIGFFEKDKCARGQLESALRIERAGSQHEFISVRWAENLKVRESGTVLADGSPEGLFTKFAIEPLSH